MKKIIALRGKGNSGKSQTIRSLAEMLLEKGFRPIVGKNFPEIIIGRTGKPRDFWQIFEANGVIVGVSSSGDTYGVVRWQLDNLINYECQVCICACRTFDKKPPGTIAAIEETVGYSKNFHPKRFDANDLTQAATNERDALDLFNLLESHLTNQS